MSAVHVASADVFLLAPLPDFSQLLTGILDSSPSYILAQLHLRGFFGSKDFTIYDYLKETLIQYGIPAEEIAFIHDAKTDACNIA